jgi:hypothetical protein
MTGLPADVWYTVIWHGDADAPTLKLVRRLCRAAHSAADRYMQALLRQLGMRIR